MKKKGFIAAAMGLLIVIGAAALALAGRRPYRALEAGDIVAATVRLTPPDQTLPIPETEELAAYLREVVVYREDDSYTEYCGQGVIFTLTMADGSQEEIMAYNPFVVINGRGYRTKYEPCEKLNAYANELLRQAEERIEKNE